MIYETAVVLNPNLGESAFKSQQEMISSVVSNFQGEVLVSDDWGVRQFPVESAEKVEGKGHFVYFMYKSNPKATAEVERRLRINENVKKFITIKLGEDSNTDVVKNYKSPFA